MEIEATTESKAPGIVLGQLIALLLILVLFDQAEHLRMMLAPFTGVITLGPVLVIVGIWLGLVLVTIPALLLRHRAAAASLAVLVLYSTVMLSVSLVPFVLILVPASLRPYAMILLNVAVLFALPHLDRRVPGMPRAQTGRAAD